MYCDSISDGLVAAGLIEVILGIVTIVMALIIDGIQIKIFTATCAITEIWCLWLVVSLIYRKLSIGIACSVKEVFMLPEYEFSRHVAAGLTLFQFYMTLCIINGSNIYNEQTAAIALLIPVFCFVKGLALHFYLIWKFYRILTGKEKQGNAIIYHEQQSKKQVTFLGILFLILTCIYYFFKSVFSALIFNDYKGNFDIQCFSGGIFLQAALMTLNSLTVIYQLIKILRQMPTVEDPHVMSPNQKCYSNWFWLVKSVLFSDGCKWQRRIAYTLWIAQGIAGIVQYPTYQVFEVTRTGGLYTKISYLYFDTLVIQGLLLNRLILLILKKFSVEKQEQIIYKFDIKIADEETQHFEKHECCICMEEIKKEQSKRKLKCHESHVFHTLCLQKWQQTQKACPICRTLITAE